MESESSDSLLDKLDSVVPAPLADFDAFPKLPSTYKSRSESRGFMTVFVGLLALLLLLNDIGEFIWGWPDYEFSVDKDTSSFVNINLDMMVAMPCRYLSVDVRDAVGDRLMLSASPKGGARTGTMRLRRDGKKFDVGKATSLREHARMLSAQQAVAQSRKSRGFFDAILRRSDSSAQFKPTPEYENHGSACRLYGQLEVKKVTANLHITVVGHGYASYEHVDHKLMNLSHVINEFSFGPYFPEMVQPLDLSYEITENNYVAYQYFMHVVPTTYIAPRSAPLRTNQYSVTHYTRELDHDKGTPGIFFKFDLDPMALTIHQRTTSFLQLIIRCVGVIGGVFVCMGYAIRITTRAVEVVAGPDDSQSIAVTASGTSTKSGLRSKWGGGHLRSRSKVVRQGSGWTVDNSNPGSPAMSTYSGYSSYANSPMPGQTAFSPNSFAGSPNPYVGSPYATSPNFPPPSNPGTPSLGPPPMRHSPSLGPPRTPSGGHSHFGPSPGSTPGTPSVYSMFPPTPNPANGESGFRTSPPPPPKRVTSGGKKDD